MLSFCAFRFCARKLVKWEVVHVGLLYLLGLPSDGTYFNQNHWSPFEDLGLVDGIYGCRIFKVASPAYYTAIWRCSNPFSQWQCSFQWKLRSRKPKILRQRHVTVVITGINPEAILFIGGRPLWPPAVPRLAARSSQSNPRGSGPEVLKRERGHVTAETGVAEVGVFRALQPNEYRVQDTALGANW